MSSSRARYLSVTESPQNAEFLQVDGEQLFIGKLNTRTWAKPASSDVTEAALTSTPGPVFWYSLP